MPEQLDLQEMINSLRTFGGGRKLTPEELLRRADEEKQQQEEKVRKFLADTIKTVGENPESKVETSNGYVENLRKSYLAQQQDTEKFRKRANMTPQELMNEYKNMFYDQKKGVGHSINRFLQGFAYGPEVDQNAAKTAYDQFPKNQQRVVDAGKAEDTSARVLETASRMRQQAVDKFNGEKQKRILDAYGKALTANNPAEIKLIEMAAKAENMDMSLMEKVKADAAKAMQAAVGNPLSNPLVTSSGQQNDILNFNGRLAMEKGIPGIMGKILGEKTQQTVDLGKMYRTQDGGFVPGPDPKQKSGPSMGAKMLQNGMSPEALMESLRNRAGQNRQQFMPGSIPSQQEASPQAPQAPISPQPQGIQPGGQSPLQPQAQMGQAPQPRMNANPLAYTPPNQSIPEKQSQTFQNKGLVTPAGPGDRYEIGVFIDPQTAANEHKYGMKAIKGQGTTAQQKDYGIDAKFVNIGNSLNNSIAEGFNTRSKFPGQTAMHRIFGSPTNQTGVSGAWNKAVNAINPWSEAPNREGAMSSLRSNILGLIGSNKNTEQAAGVLQANLNQLVGKFDDDPGTQKVFTDINMNLSKLLSSYTKSITGSQVNEKELELFSVVVPDLFKSPETAATMIMNLTTRAGMINSLRASKYPEQTIYELMNNPQIEEEIKNYTRAYADDLVSQIPNNSSRPGVKARGPVDKARLNPANILGSIAEKYPDAFKGVVVRPKANTKSTTMPSVPSAASPQKLGYQDAMEQYKRWRPQ